MEQRRSGLHAGYATHELGCSPCFGLASCGCVSHIVILCHMTCHSVTLSCYCVMCRVRWRTCVLLCWTRAPSVHCGRSWTSSGAAHHHHAAGTAGWGCMCRLVFGVCIVLLRYKGLHETAPAQLECLVCFAAVVIVQHCPAVSTLNNADGQCYRALASQTCQPHWSHVDVAGGV